MTDVDGGVLGFGFEFFSGLKGPVPGGVVQMTTIAEEPSDNVRPEVRVISPMPGTPIQRDEVLVVEVDDNVALSLSLLYVEFPGNRSEVVHTGTAFLVPYASRHDFIGSEREPIDTGWRYHLRREGGWPGDVALTAVAVDTSGNVSE